MCPCSVWHLLPASRPREMALNPDAVIHTATCPSQFRIISDLGKHTSQICSRGADRKVHRPGSIPEHGGTLPRGRPLGCESYKTALRVSVVQSHPELMPGRPPVPLSYSYVGQGRKP